MLAPPPPRLLLLSSARVFACSLIVSSSFLVLVLVLLPLPLALPLPFSRFFSPTRITPILQTAQLPHNTHDPRTPSSALTEDGEAGAGGRDDGERARASGAGCVGDEGGAGGRAGHGCVGAGAGTARDSAALKSVAQDRTGQDKRARE
eukprot:2085133-Rhodomonas_salina.1